MSKPSYFGRKDTGLINLLLIPLISKPCGNDNRAAVRYLTISVVIQPGAERVVNPSMLRRPQTLNALAFAARSGSGKRKVGRVRYEARSRGRSSLATPWLFAGAMNYP